MTDWLFRWHLRVPLLLLCAAAPLPGLAAAQTPAQSQAPAETQMSVPIGPAPASQDAQCDYFARLHRFGEESKSLCDEGRQVVLGPVTRHILEQCRQLQGKRFDRLPVDDMMADFSRQVSAQGLGNACHAIKLQVWDLIAQ